MIFVFVKSFWICSLNLKSTRLVLYLSDECGRVKSDLRDVV